MRICALMLAIVVLPVQARQAASPAAPSRPNIILIVADDLGWGDLGSYGQKIIRTPHLDRMAKEGLRFTNFHAGAPVCLPSRCALMTGLHLGHARLRNNIIVGSKPPAHEPIQEEDTLLSEVIRAAGYQTGMIGKWAMGDNFIGNTVPEQNIDGPGAVYKHGWDYYFGEPNQSYNARYFPEHLYLMNRLQPETLADPVTPRNTLVPVRVGGRYSHDVLVEKALAFIDGMRDRRFFLYLALQIPHWDWIGVEEEAYVKGQPWTAKERAYASMITRMDRDVGRIIDRLKQHGIDDKTLVLFTSDNGAVKEFVPRFNSNGGLPGGKGTMEDGGLRVPMIARWPGHVPAGTNDELFAFYDVLPTLAELVGIRAPEPIDGISFLPTLLGREQSVHHNYLYFRWQVQRVVRAPWEKRAEEEIMKMEYFPPGRVLVPTWNPDLPPERSFNSCTVGPRPAGR